MRDNQPVGLAPRMDPRVLRSRGAALAAVEELILEEGLLGVTHVAVAARSGVGRTTLYRHWADPAALIRDAILHRISRAKSPQTGALRTDLVNELIGLKNMLGDPVTELSMRAVLERAPFDPAFAALKEELYRSGSAGIRNSVEDAVARGELPPDTDVSQLIDQLAGPLMYRRLFAGLDIDEDYPQRIVDGVLNSRVDQRGRSSRSSPRREPRR